MALPLNLRDLDVRELRKALTDTSALTGRPLYAVAGAGDAAVQQLRVLPGRLASLRPALDPADVALRALAFPAQARRLPVAAQDAVQSAVTDLGNRAGGVYGGLAVRGEDVVRRIRRQESAQEVVATAETTVKRTRKTATTAKKSAARTGSAAKKTAKAAQATGKAATKAVEDGASELG